MEYKNTLNLPKTNFSMKANLAQLEPRMLAQWQKAGIYQKIVASRAGCPQFLLHDGPPYANGHIHIGHALNKILKDIIIKYKTLRGFSVPYIPGWDCHGLPVEHQLFKELGKTKHDVETVDFRKQAKKFALKFVKLQREEFEKLGIFGDWDNPYLTLTPGYERGMIELLARLNDSGYVYRGRKPVNWCASCETALAEAEVEYADKQSDSIYFLFSVKDGKHILEERNTYFLVWTTTPWTLVSNVAVAIHPDFEYCLAEINGKNVILLAGRQAALTEKFGTQITIQKVFKGKELEGIVVTHPFLEDAIERAVLMADFVSSADGSGCVHIAPGHGVEDFSLTRTYTLEIPMPVNDKGCFDGPQPFTGKNIKEANALALEMLEAKQRLVKAEKIQHSYPHCWRCKNPIIFRATYQWFVSIDHKGLRAACIKETDRVQWVPASGKERMQGMLLTRPDWCLSRQRLWGVPIPALRCAGCGNVSLDSAVLAKTAEVFSQRGADSWFYLGVEDFLPDGHACVKCGSAEFKKENDILDVWFESGVSFYSVGKNNPALRFPADLYLEGSDQHRGWFQVSLIPSVALEQKAPFKAILTHGFVVDGEGRKMSKSIGNVIAPQEISKQYGAEILRLWAASSDYSEDVKISDGIVKQLADTYRKIRNTFRFLFANTYDYTPHDEPAHAARMEVDRYMLSRTAALVEEVTARYDEYAFYKAAQAIFSFCNQELSSFYLDILKDRLYTFSPNAPARRSAQSVLHTMARVLLKLCAPILPFTAEEAYGMWANEPEKSASIFLTTIDTGLCSQWRDTKLEARWSRILEMRQAVLREIETLRSRGDIGSSLEAQVRLSFEGAAFEEYLGCEDILRETCIVSQVMISKGPEAIVVKKADGKKCQRCWNWRHDVDTHNAYPGACGRCADALLHTPQVDAL